MAPGFSGADVAQLRALSKALGQSGNRLSPSSPRSTPWCGRPRGRDATATPSAVNGRLRSGRCSIAPPPPCRTSRRNCWHRPTSRSRPVVPGNSLGTRSAQPVPATALRDGTGRRLHDPNYVHAPSGWSGYWGSSASIRQQARRIASALQFVAARSLEPHLLKRKQAPANSLRHEGVGKGSSAGVVLGALDIASGIENRYLFRVADVSWEETCRCRGVAATASVARGGRHRRGRPRVGLASMHPGTFPSPRDLGLRLRSGRWRQRPGAA